MAEMKTAFSHGQENLVLLKSKSKLWVEDIVLLALPELARQPIKSFVQSIPSGRTSRLDVPLSRPYCMKVQLVREFCYIHGIWKVLEKIKQKLVLCQTGRMWILSFWLLSVITHNKWTVGSEAYLFVGQHQDHSVTQLIFLQHLEELLLGLTNALSIVAVHNKDDTWNKNNIYQTGAMCVQWMKKLNIFRSRSQKQRLKSKYVLGSFKNLSVQRQCDLFWL